MVHISAAQVLALRARIMLGAAADRSNTQVAAELGVPKQMVGKWRQRFLERRMDGLLDEPRPGGPGTIGEAQVEAVIMGTRESILADATHWSTRMSCLHRPLLPANF